MRVPRNPRLLNVDQLADECADHTARFFSRATHDTGYCYELFRRAIVDRNSYAWEQIFHQYQSLVASWVRRHSGLRAAGEDVDYLVNCAFDKMWSAMDADKFHRFTDVAGLLRYLQLCVHSVIVDHARGNQTKTVELDALPHLPSQDLPSIEKRVTDLLEGRRLWQAVTALTQNEKESIILKYSFLYDLKPSEIYAANPDRFESLEELYRVKRNLLNRMRRNPMLQQFLHH
jgi:DNA-directed RNA polymerase specialized sigma24 family protein